MLRSILFLLLLTVATVNAFHSYYTELGPWGLESAIIKDVKSTRKEKDIKEVKNTNTSRKSSNKKDKNKAEEVKSDMNDELEQAEEAFFRAEQKVEHAIVHALDEEVETFFPHHQKSEE